MDDAYFPYRLLQNRNYFVGYYYYEDELGTLNYICISSIKWFHTGHCFGFRLPFISSVSQLGSFFKFSKNGNKERKCYFHRFHKRIHGPRHCWNHINNNNIYFISNELILYLAPVPLHVLCSVIFLNLCLILVIEFFCFKC